MTNDLKTIAEKHTKIIYNMYPAFIPDRLRRKIESEIEAAIQEYAGEPRAVMTIEGLDTLSNRILHLAEIAGKMEDSLKASARIEWLSNPTKRKVKKTGYVQLQNIVLDPANPNIDSIKRPIADGLGFIKVEYEVEK